jgi:Kdo2-lipid IVA lauroyltransferase/acyltransferase
MQSAPLAKAPAARPPLWRRLRWLIVAAPAYLLFGLLSVLPLDAASRLGGWLARTLGPLLGVSGRARRALARTFPEKSPAEIERIVAAMWDNLGRTAGELPHLDRLVGPERQARIEFVGAHHIEAAKAAAAPSMFCAGHLGNWELAAMIAPWFGLDMRVIYRAANNPHVDRLIQYCRRPVACDFVAKGVRAAHGIADAMKRGGAVGLLVDQKTNSGIAASFLGRPAMTTPMPAMCALKYGCRVFPMRVERLGGARFRITVHEPLAFTPTGDRHADVLALTDALNAVVEGWIRQRPEQWLWLHKRWADD